MRLTQKQETFCLKYIEVENNGTQAVIAAGYKCKPSVAHSIATENLQKPAIIERIKQLRQKLEDASIATPLERRQVLTEIVRGRFINFMTKLTPEKLKSAALQEIRITEGEGKKTTTVKLHSPIQAADLLNKMDKIYSEGTTFNIDNRKVEAQIVHIDAAEIARAIIEAYRLGLAPAILGGDGHGEDASLLSSSADIQATPIPEPED